MIIDLINEVGQDVLLRICKALSSKKRIEMIKEISKGNKCHKDLADKFNMSQELITYHIKLLIKAELIVEVEGINKKTKNLKLNDKEIEIWLK